MHAIRLYEFGPAGNLRYETVDDPVPGPGQVRIAVAAAGVHVIDTSIRAGDAPPGQKPDLPATLGRDAAGTVDALKAAGTTGEIKVLVENEIPLAEVVLPRSGPSSRSGRSPAVDPCRPCARR